MRKHSSALARAAYVLVPALAVTSSTSVSPATAAPNWRVKVTCTVPDSQPERQLARNWCFNYVPDRTQTYTARVINGDGDPVAGARVKWSDSSSSAYFRVPNNPCTTNRRGVCSDELVERRPRKGKKVKITATAGGATGGAWLTFQKR